MTIILIFFALGNIVFISFMLIGEWRRLTVRAKKFLAFFTLGVFPLFWGLGVVSQDLERVKKVSFCAKCHVMTKYVESLNVDDDEPLSAIHFQNNWVPQEEACYACHTQYTMFGPVQAKLRGVKHLYVYYVKGAPEKIKLYEKYENRNCLRCHGVARNFIEALPHMLGDGLSDQIMDGRRSCLSSGCHDMGHLLASEEDW